MVRNILKSGKEVKTVKGHIIRKADCPEVYQIIGGKK